MWNAPENGISNHLITGRITMTLLWRSSESQRFCKLDGILLFPRHIYGNSSMTSSISKTVVIFFLKIMHNYTFTNIHKSRDSQIYISTRLLMLVVIPMIAFISKLNNFSHHFCIYLKLSPTV